jgi:hypothetical protein
MVGDHPDTYMMSVLEDNVGILAAMVPNGRAEAYQAVVGDAEAGVVGDNIGFGAGSAVDIVVGTFVAVGDADQEAVGVGGHNGTLARLKEDFDTTLAVRAPEVQLPHPMAALELSNMVFGHRVARIEAGW